jgi:hypothetical protein
MNEVRMTFQFTKEDAELLATLASDESVYRTQILRRGIKLVQMLANAQKAGAKILIEKDGAQSELRIL